MIADDLDLAPGETVGFRHNSERLHPCDFSCGGTWVCTLCGEESQDPGWQHECQRSAPAAGSPGAPADDFHGNAPAPFKPVVGRPGKPVLPASPPVPATRVHELKTWPEPFAAILDGRKRFEVRRADRPFAIGDELHLREWSPGIEAGYAEGYTGRETRVRVTYLVAPGKWGLPPDLCVMGIAPAAPVPDAIREALDAYRDACFDLGLASGKGHATLATPERARGLVESSLRDEVSGRTRAEDQARDHLARAIRAERALTEADRDRSDLRMMLAAAVAATDTAKRDLDEARAEVERLRAERDEAVAKVERLVANYDDAVRAALASVPPGARSPGGAK